MGTSRTGILGPAARPLTISPAQTRGKRLSRADRWDEGTEGLDHSAGPAGAVRNTLTTKWTLSRGKHLPGLNAFGRAQHAVSIGAMLSVAPIDTALEGPPVEGFTVSGIVCIRA